MSFEKKIVIIGGGITGLSTAYFLKEKAKEQGVAIHCSVLESNTRFGGKIITDRIDDFIIEGGPDSFLAAKPWGLTLCRKLGLIDQVVQTHPVHKAVYLLSQGKLKPFPEGMNLMIPGKIIPFLFTSLVSSRVKARMGLDLLIPRKADPEDESIASFVRRRLGEEAVSTFAEPILATIYAGDVESLSMKATFPQFMGLEKEFGSLIWGIWMKQWDAIRGGRQQTTPAAGVPAAGGGEKDKGEPFSLFVTLQNGLITLISTLQERLEKEGIHLRLGQKVCEIASHEKGYRIRLSNETLDADAVVLTVDAATAAGLIKPMNGTLSNHLSGISYVSTATVSLGFRREDVAHPLNGFGFVIPRSERKIILATTWSSTKFAGRADPSHVLIRSFCGGAHQQEVVDLPDEELLSRVHKELEPVLGIRGKPTASRVFKWRAANPQYNVGHLDRVAAIEKEASKHPGLFLAGSAYKGVGIPDCIEQGGEAAEKVLRFLKHG